jgi:hypothetical protein
MRRRIGLPLPLGTRTGRGGRARRPTAHNGRRDGGDGRHDGCPVRRRAAGRTAPIVVQRGAKTAQVVVYAEEEDEENEREDGWSCVCRCSEKGRWGRPGPGPGWRFLPSARMSSRHDVGMNLRVEKFA